MPDKPVQGEKSEPGGRRYHPLTICHIIYRLTA
ncbi:hypothetical protein AFE_2198 [Acidithiobacillus ferrooxidans ATCC 23270]|uniref:Uncharacterized protein n=1 Tax=Acidithiobacillus ferrooxidans (strain ATCC 23270 / DSM 14882 / CIP 104768 / NCIMB 8455) TaxID=243159 RepID=B7J5I5_ACIF2|nr:hypothetical protein AFE_2198 [Acidithiobacillus ferrooxidans ATCC 23270]